MRLFPRGVVVRVRLILVGRRGYLSLAATFIAASSLGFQRTSPPILYGLHRAHDRRLRFKCFLIGAGSVTRCLT